MADVLANTLTTAQLSVGTATTNALETSGDHDWFAVNLNAGVQVTITVYGITLEDPFLNLRTSSGQLIASNDDIKDGENRNSLLTFTPTTSGIYYVDVGAFNDAYSGTYQVSVDQGTQTPVSTVDTIAAYVTQGNWGGDYHHFAVGQGGTLTVNITALAGGEVNLARTALQEWSDIIGVQFQEVATGGQIVFDNTEQTPGTPTAQTGASWSEHITSSAHVQISSSWVNTYGTELDSYSLQTYIHEIGHALGLGHSGDYDGSATYSTDALFRNDGWPMTVMSYFDQGENSYFANQQFSRALAVTPMVADIVAMQTLYGLSTTTRTGDTVYGFGTNAGGIYDVSRYPYVAVTIYDSGGNDTLNYSGAKTDQLINLNPETFSNVNGEIGNLSIGRGVTIENAIGGSAWDTIIGNAADNVLDGGEGFDIVSYETATAGVHIDTRITGPQNTIGAGVDTLTNFEGLRGSKFDDVIIASSAMQGIDGNDGNDTFMVVSSPASIRGGLGFDTVDLSLVNHGVNVFTSFQLDPTGSSTILESIDKIIGTAFDDNLRSDGSRTLVGGAGSDQLYGGIGVDTFLDTIAGHNGDRIGDLGIIDRIVFSDASPGTFGFSLTDNILGFTGGALTLLALPPGAFVPSAWAGGGVQLSLSPHAFASVYEALRYVASNADLIPVFGLNQAEAEAHYISNGKAEGRSTTAFDPLLYAASNTDLAGVFGSDVLALTKHYIQYGSAEGRHTSGFNALEYAASNPDLAAYFGSDQQALLKHYLDWGLHEGRPTTTFNALLYAASNPDLANFFGSNEPALLQHYLDYGVHEGRPTSGFDVLHYEASNTDLADYFGNDLQGLLRHYDDYGVHEGRTTTAFDEVAYLINNSDLGSAGLDAHAALMHWIQYGHHEGRVGDGAFGAEQTTHGLIQGVELHSSFEVSGDLDWYSANFTQGTPVHIDLTPDGAGEGGFVRLYDDHGQLLVSDVDTGAGDSASLTFNPATSDSYIIVLGNSSGPGGYAVDFH